MSFSPSVLGDCNPDPEMAARLAELEADAALRRLVRTAICFMGPAIPRRRWWPAGRNPARGASDASLVVGWEKRRT
jgi:hypothetical protein